MATTTTNFGWDIPQSTDLVKDGATAIAALGQDIDTALVDLKGGTTGQVLAKASGNDLDFSWVAQDDSNAIQNTIVDAKGDLISATGSDTPARLAVGTNGQVLVADSTAATGLAWAAAPAGKVLQVVQSTTSTEVTIASTSFTDSGLTCAITPSSASSKILVFTCQNFFSSRSNDASQGAIRLMRDATAVLTIGTNGYEALGLSVTGGTAVNLRGTTSLAYLDTPATTSSVTYKTQGRSNATSNSGQLVFQNSSSGTSTIILMEIGA